MRSVERRQGWPWLWRHRATPSARWVVIVAAAWLFAIVGRPDRAEASVTLSDFRTQSAPDHVRVLWETGTELNNLGFYVWRGQSASRDVASRLTSALIPSQVGGQATGASYEYADYSATAGAIYYYWLEAVDTSDGRQFEGPVQGTFGGQSPLATVTPGAPGGALPTSTMAPTGTPAPTATPRPTATVRPGVTATSLAPTAPPTMTPAGIGTTALATATSPAPSPTAAPTEGPPLATVPATKVAETGDVASMSQATPSGADEVAAAVPTEALQSVGSRALPPTPTLSMGAASASGQGAATGASGLTPLAWLGLLAGIVALAGGGGALYLVLRRQADSS